MTWKGKERGGGEITNWSKNEGRPDKFGQQTNNNQRNIMCIAPTTMCLICHTNKCQKNERKINRSNFIEREREKKREKDLVVRKETLTLFQTMFSK